MTNQTHAAVVISLKICCLIFQLRNLESQTTKLLADPCEKNWQFKNSDCYPHNGAAPLTKTKNIAFDTHSNIVLLKP